jgi:hypothetical protein
MRQASEEKQVDFLNESQRRAVFTKVLETVDKKFMGSDPETETLQREHGHQILKSRTAEEFESAMNGMLRQLGTSHTGFFHEGRPRAAGRIAIAATLTKANTSDARGGCSRTFIPVASPLRPAFAREMSW